MSIYRCQLNYTNDVYATRLFLLLNLCGITKMIAIYIYISLIEINSAKCYNIKELYNSLIYDFGKILILYRDSIW